MLETAVFLAGSVALLAAPLIPALRELKNPSDAAPLMVYHGNRADATEALRDALSSYQKAVSAGESPAAMVARRLGQDAVEILPGGYLPLWLDRDHRSALCVEPCAIEDRFQADIAVWAPSILVGPTGAFGGKMTAATVIQLTDRVTFRTAQAPTIQTGTEDVGFLGIKDLGLPEVSPVGATWLDLQQRFQALEKFVVKRHSRAKGLIVSAGPGWVEEGALVNGSIKCHGHLSIADGATVVGNLVADSVSVGKHCVILGAILAKSTITIGTGSLIGTEGDGGIPATVAAAEITLGNNVSIHGAVVAHQEARVDYAI